MNLNGCLNWGFVAFWSFNNLTSSRISSGGSGLALTVQFHQFGQVESGPFQDLDLSDVNVVQGIDSLACLLDVNGNGIGDELVDSFLQVHRCNLTGNDIYHLLANLANLKYTRNIEQSSWIHKSINSLILNNLSEPLISSCYGCH